MFVPCSTIGLFRPSFYDGVGPSTSEHLILKAIFCGKSCSNSSLLCFEFESARPREVMVVGDKHPQKLRNRNLYRRMLTNCWMLQVRFCKIPPDLQNPYGFCRIPSAKTLNKCSEIDYVTLGVGGVRTLFRLAVPVSKSRRISGSMRRPHLLRSYFDS